MWDQAAKPAREAEDSAGVQWELGHLLQSIAAAKQQETGLL